MRAKLDDDKIKYIICEEKGTPNAAIAESMDIGARHVRRLWARYRNTGSLPATGRGGRPATKTISDEEVELVPAECGSGGSGAGWITWHRLAKTYAGAPYTR